MTFGARWQPALIGRTGTLERTAEDLATTHVPRTVDCYAGFRLASQLASLTAR